MKEALLGLFHHTACVFVLGEVLGDVNAADLEFTDPLYSRPVDVDGVMSPTPLPVVHDQLLGLINVERQVVLLTTPCQDVDLSPRGHLIIVGDQANTSRVVSKLNHQVLCRGSNLASA